MAPKKAAEKKAAAPAKKEASKTAEDKSHGSASPASHSVAESSSKHDVSSIEGSTDFEAGVLFSR